MRLKTIRTGTALRLSRLAFAAAQAQRHTVEASPSSVRSRRAAGRGQRGGDLPAPRPRCDC